MFKRKTTVIRFKSGAFAIFNTGYVGNEWNFLHICHNMACVDQWLDTLSINRRYVSYRYY